MIETPKTISEWSEQVFPTLEEESQKKDAEIERLRALLGERK